MRQHDKTPFILFTVDHVFNSADANLDNRRRNLLSREAVRQTLRSDNIPYKHISAIVGGNILYAFLVHSRHAPVVERLIAAYHSLATYLVVDISGGAALVNSVKDTRVVLGSFEEVSRDEAVSSEKGYHYVDAAEEKYYAIV